MPTLNDDIAAVAAYIEQCQYEGTQPDMDYVEAFRRIISHLNVYKQDNVELRRDVLGLEQKLNLIESEIGD